ncbi:2750_t:CDS:2, partial [Funneliformis geosporum]
MPHHHSLVHVAVLVYMNDTLWLDFLSALMLTISLVNSGQKISNIGLCPNCPADTVPDMDFQTSCVCQKSPEQRQLDQIDTSLSIQESEC